MFIIDKNNKIILTKGDTATINLVIKTLDGDVRSIEDGDTIHFTVRKTPGASISFQKTLSDKKYFIINPEDTSSLDSGLYIYSCELQNSAGAHYTIIPTSFFQLLEDTGV